ncbi:MAG: hypothetical protein DMG57_28975 [Acidobacteria bacterium]|nr:MAG: hypothetical protein DMG57_28975 [Acidobacteriota bacterium]
MAGRWDVDLATPTAQAEFLLDFRESFPKGEFSAAYGPHAANQVAWLAEQLTTAASAEPFVKAEIEDQLAVELELWNFFWDIAEKLKPYFAEKPHVPSSELKPPLERLKQYLAKVPFETSRSRLVAAVLYLDENLAADLALALELPLPFPWAFDRELGSIQQSRKLRGLDAAGFQGANAWEKAQKAELTGLAFSGGGIRSATFNLGVAQAAAELDALHHFDYLSTVSGGGYVGTWLDAWVKRAGRRYVEDSLSPKKSPDPESEQTTPLKFLRRYSNYLTPQVGLFSADTWTLIAIWLRNTLLNLFILIAALSAMLLLPRTLTGFIWFVFRSFSANTLIGPTIAPLVMVVAVVVIATNLRSFTHPDMRENKFIFQQRGIQLLVVVPVLLSALTLAACIWFKTSNVDVQPMLRDIFFYGTVVCTVFLWIMALAGGYAQSFCENEEEQSKRLAGLKAFVGIVLSGLFSGLVGGLLLYTVGALFSTWKPPSDVWHVVAWGTPLMVAVFSVVLMVQIGLLGRNFPDARREWWSRLGAWLAIYSLSWCLLFGIAVYGPLLIAGIIHTTHGAIASSGLGIGWVASTIWGIIAGRSKATGPKPPSQAREQSGFQLQEYVARIAPVVFIAGLLLLLSFGIHMMTLHYVRCPNPDTDINSRVCRYSNSPVLTDFQALTTFHFRLMEEFPGNYAVYAALSLFALALLISWRVDINEFSMHHFYKNRLVRCYLGASHQTNRHPNRFTGFDPDDDIRLSDFTPSADGGYAGPYPILNTALNLVHGDELAWQERRAESFSFTPDFSGFAVSRTEEISAERERPPSALNIYGYRPTRNYAYPNGGLHIGTVMAISGAAASPNMGYNSSPTSAFLMTVFNVRLGWWLGNPRHKTSWRRSGPGLGLFYLLNELTANTNNKSQYIYLSDGGHFENLGIYELARRRCRYIVCSDGSEDHAYSFEGLGNAVRKCRTDLGAEIDIHPLPIRPEPGSRFSDIHYVTGKIQYRDGSTGTLIYIKSSLSKNAPADVLEYASRQTQFPHQSTGDQWFDESQFESYRKLGYYVGNIGFTELLGKLAGEQAARAAQAGKR